MAKKVKLSPQENFENYYKEIYQDRWDLLKSYLTQESKPINLSEKLIKPYYMDEGSIIASSFLPVKPGDKVLDMCAAPGGKTLNLALKLQGEGLLVSNDRSATRRGRLKKVISSCLDENLNKIIKVTSYDATKWMLYEKNAYDCILLDAPCSSERHVLVDSKALSQWSAQRPKRLSYQQFAMLASALEAVKVNGFVLYSTCSITPQENEKVIEKLYKKREGRFLEIPLSSPIAEKCEHGQIILPDKSQNVGPLFFCLIKRIK